MAPHFTPPVPWNQVLEEKSENNVARAALPPGPPDGFQAPVFLFECVTYLVFGGGGECWQSETEIIVVGVK